MQRSRPSRRVLVPKFHFRIQDGADLPDHNGLDLTDVSAAKAEAMKLAGAVLGDTFAGEVWHGTPVVSTSR